ncbi:beta-glucanase/Beta-glucan synthetase [Gynuella sunshinyii YC6258]|uniref:Beta-glucanase/Beta-glucan synthetase n=2 Tax=Gynuella sunshinyii TaxID=1445505 RepID=A0A0C5V074_9GAMM|nr:beta-glucanase/Beta-glucan synthetase [Gynuella sunshinyii YC6258]
MQAIMYRTVIILFATVCLSGCKTDGEIDEPTSPDKNEAIVKTKTDNFTMDSSLWDSRMQEGASIIFGDTDSHADDGHILSLVFPGNPALQSTDRTSPEFATEVWTQQALHYGRYEVKVQFARCAADEEVVSGIFTYHNNGEDLNQNGLSDNSEIDIEYLCGEPHLLWLTTWTDSDDAGFRKKTRSINMSTGEMYQTPDGGEDNYDTEYAGNLSTVRLADFPAAQTYYHLGFEWYEDRVRWFMVMDDQEITLWDMTDRTMVPQHAANFMLNVWHAATHWSSGEAGDYPGNDSTLKVDWFNYQPFD